MRLLSVAIGSVAILAVVAAYLPAVLLALVAGPLQRILDQRSLAGDERALPIKGSRDLRTSGRQVQPAEAEDRSRQAT
jgi:hypothetical protein